MANQEQVSCHVCGFSNAAKAERCVSCGAKIQGIVVDYTAEEIAAKRHQQDTFEPKWVAIALGGHLVLQGLFLLVLPKVIPAYDPQGFPGLMVCGLAWFIGGVVVGAVSPGRTFFEPAAAAFLVAFPTIGYLMHVTPSVPPDMAEALGGSGFAPSTMAYIVGGGLGVVISMFGAFIGEKFQTRK